MERFIFDKNKVTIGKGRKTDNDYVILQNGTQIRDRSLFENILSNIPNEGEAKIFLDCFSRCPLIKFGSDRITTTTSQDKIYQYCLGCRLKSESQELLFISILRCDIDNICYPYPKNGCIRIFVQLLLLLSYKFGWKTYINNSTIPKDIADYVYQIGFKKDRGNIEYFKKIYDKYIDNNKNSL